MYRTGHVSPGVHLVEEPRVLGGAHHLLLQPLELLAGGAEVVPGLLLPETELSVPDSHRKWNCHLHPVLEVGHVALLLPSHRRPLEIVNHYN